MQYLQSFVLLSLYPKDYNTWKANMIFVFKYGHVSTQLYFYMAFSSGGDYM